MLKYIKLRFVWYQTSYVFFPGLTLMWLHSKGFLYKRQNRFFHIDFYIKDKINFSFSFKKLKAWWAFPIKVLKQDFASFVLLFRSKYTIGRLIDVVCIDQSRFFISYPWKISKIFDFISK